MITVLITTYNRPLLLTRAIASVLRQDFEAMQVIVIDDGSTDETKQAVHSFRDERVRYVRNDTNVGSVEGDLGVLRGYLRVKQPEGHIVYLCDDDYWLPKDLLTRQFQAFVDHPSLAFVQGGMAHVYPHPIELIAPNEPYVTYSRATDDTTIYWGTLFPEGFMTGDDYLKLFADDTKNRNIVIGATLFRSDVFRDSIERCKGVRWQAGYAIIAGAATKGDVFYIDKPCVMVAVDIESASHRGTQKDHMVDCLASIHAAFNGSANHHDVRTRMGRSVIGSYLCNKIGNRMGSFKENPLGDLSGIMTNEVSASEFIDFAEIYTVPLTAGQRRLIELADGPPEHLERIPWNTIVEMAKG